MIGVTLPLRHYFYGPGDDRNFRTQAFKESLEGPRFIEAIRGARAMRERAFRKHVSKALGEIDWEYRG